jgi:hypothetical protein
MKNLSLLTALAFTVTSYTTFPVAWPLSPASPTGTTTTATYSPLHTKGPYFSYIKKVDDHQELVYLEPDGSGRKVEDLPANVHINNLSAVSPHGNLLVYYTGNVGGFQSQGEPPYTLTLNILNLTTGQVETTIPLLSPDYPATFTKAAPLLIGSSFDDFEFESEISSDSLHSAFDLGIQSFSWSPSGRYLAFAGQMNKLSSNLYVLDLYTHTIQQLSDGPEEIGGIGTWSVDEQQINYFSDVIGPHMGDEVTGHSYIASLDGISEPYHYQSIGGFVNNLSDYENAFANTPQMDVPNDLRVYSSQTKTVDTIWEDCLFSYATDRQSRTILFSPMADDGEPEDGLVLYDRQTGTYTTVQESQEWYIRPWHTPTFRYLAYSQPKNEILAVTSKGQSQVVNTADWRTDTSPDNKWLVLYQSKGRSSMLFYTPDAKLTVEVKDVQADEIIWQNGSQSMFLISRNQLTYMNTTDFKPVVVDIGLDDYFNYTWASVSAK